MAKRKSIHIKGMEHGAPIPNGAVLGNIIFSSAISGKDAATGVVYCHPTRMSRRPRCFAISGYLWKTLEAVRPTSVI